MANRFANPDIQYFSADGATPLSGGLLFFYISGTSTKLNTYSNAGLTIANPNPVILDSSGRCGPIWLQNLQYKVLLCPSTDTDPPSSPIWTQDPVYASDVSTVAQFFSGSGNPNGNVAGTAGSSTIPASAYWDFTNDILYICTTTGNAASAVWTSVNPASSAAIVTPPQGYLTPVSGTPVITGDSTAATTIYYTPYVGLLVPIYNGTNFIPTSIVSELQCSLTSSLAANNIYDFYIFSNSGIATLGSGPSWSAGSGGSIAAGSCARGTGVGGSALTRLQGFLTNSVSMTMRYGNGTTTTTVAANQGTYIGSLFMDGTNGQVSCYVSAGQSRKYGVWNAYNRNPITLQVHDSTSSWSVGVTVPTYQAANANSANSFTSFCGLAEESIWSEYQAFSNTVAAARFGWVGVGFNSITTVSGVVGNGGTGISGDFQGTIRGFYINPPSLGINVFTALESSTTSASFSGTIGGGSGMQLTGKYLG